MPTSFWKTHQPCPCGKSHDAYAYNRDGSGKCFSCGKRHSGAVAVELEIPITEEIPEGTTYQFVAWRGISAETMRFFNVTTRVDASGKPTAVAAPFGDDARQIRAVSEKKFWSQGKMSEASLFGKERFEAGGQSVTITEGWLDALSSYQVLKRPTVSVRSAVVARKDCSRDREWLNSFDRIYLALDSDAPGQKAAGEIASLFDFNKVYQVHLNRKDANEYLQAGEEDAYRQAWYSAKRFLPEGIISSPADFHSIIDEDHHRESVPYPFAMWNEKTEGIRTGEVVLLSADEGVGKTEILRAIEYHVLTTTKTRIGTIHLEESKDRQLKGLCGYLMNQPAHRKDSTVSKEDLHAAIDILAADERLHFYQHFDSNDPDCILDRVRFMASSCGCKLITLDPLSKLVSGIETDDERRKLDYISTKLDQMARDLDFACILTAHENKEGRIRSSTYPSKVAALWLRLKRDIAADSEEERNRTYILCPKNRWTGNTGPFGYLSFNPETFKVSEAEGLPT